MATVTIRPKTHRDIQGALEPRLKRALEGEVRFGRFDRGRYATDASIYQIEPLGVVIPRTTADVEATLEIVRDEGVSVTFRGGGTSQAGQTVGAGLVIDTSKYLNSTDDPEPGDESVWVEPGIVLDELNRRLKPYGLMFPVDISTGSQATIGGMTANHSCGSRSLRYGVMVDNVQAIDSVLADGSRTRFGLEGDNEWPVPSEISRTVSTIMVRERDEIAARFPKTARQVGGYNLDRLDPGGDDLTKLLVGSEGTLAYFRKIKLKLTAPPRNKVLGVCHFPTFFEAMDSAQHIVRLDPTAVELVDRSILDLARAIPAFASLLPSFVRGEPDALLLVEFAGDDLGLQQSKLRQLEDLMGELGLPGAVVEAEAPAFQSDIWELRKAGLNIVMSMKGDGKPVSFIEDCAVPLEHLAGYTSRLNEVFARHGTKGTWYAHASVGCLHVRPILNLKLEAETLKMRAIAEEAMAMVREYKGAHSGEHGDGLARSEFHEPMFGPRIVRAFEEVKDSFDPDGLLNPGKIVRSSRMDDRTLFRFKPGHAPLALKTALNWSEWGGFLGVSEMCNNNGACRKLADGVMCPSYRATRDERDTTRGRANSLRLALSGQLGEGALTDRAMYDTLELCVGCKACKRECPTGVDMARMKTEFLYHYHRRHPRRLRERVIAELPRLAPHLSKLAPLANLGQRAASYAGLGFDRRRTLPAWRTDSYRAAGAQGPGDPVLLFADTFNRYFEPDNLRAAETVLGALGFAVETADPSDERPLCCGRTYLAAGMVEEARREARRTARALTPFVESGTPIVGLEPSCLLTLRDEFAVLLPQDEFGGLGQASQMLTEFLDKHLERMPVRNDAAEMDVIYHGHCHEKAFGTVPALHRVLEALPGCRPRAIGAGCCGMAGAFGYRAETFDTSMRMAEASLLPAVREAAPSTEIVANGFSCRHQIMEGSGREARHIAQFIADSLRL